MDGEHDPVYLCYLSRLTGPVFGSSRRRIDSRVAVPFLEVFEENRSIPKITRNRTLAKSSD